MSRTVAAIDCGTNTIRLLVVRREGDDVLELLRRVELARLGQGVDATGEFHPDALARAFRVCDLFRRDIDRLGVDATRFVATSAARDARNRREFFAGVRERLATEVEVISGDEEARLGFAGVLAGVTPAFPALTLDIGGGSTELVIGDENGVRQAISLNVGAVRLHERALASDPPTDAEVASARELVASLLDGSGIDFGAVRQAVGVAGTATSMAARDLGLTTYDRARVHGHVLTRDAVAGHTEHWLTTPVAEIMTEPCMQPLRAEVIGAGAIILDEICTRVPGGSVTISETDLLDGVAADLLKRSH